MERFHGRNKRPIQAEWIGQSERRGRVALVGMAGVRTLGDVLFGIPIEGLLATG